MQKFIFNFEWKEYNSLDIHKIYVCKLPGNSELYVQGNKNGFIARINGINSILFEDNKAEVTFNTLDDAKKVLECTYLNQLRASITVLEDKPRLEENNNE